jgi:hypothetical protein
VRNDYFSLVYLDREFEINRDLAITQVTFGGNDNEIDAFHFGLLCESSEKIYLHSLEEIFERDWL